MDENSYAMHTIKITPNLLFEYHCTSGKFIRLPNGIESKLFFPNWNALVTMTNHLSAAWRACRRRYQQVRAVTARSEVTASPQHERSTRWNTSTSSGAARICNRGEVRYGSIGGLEYEVPQSRLYCLCINVARRPCMYLSCDKKKFHDNESTQILHNFWTSPSLPWRRHCLQAAVLFKLFVYLFI